MSATRCLLLFPLDAQRYGLPLECVERVVQVVEITPLPEAPAVVLGLVSVQGRVVVTVDPRRRLGLPVREMQLSDQLIIARTRRRTVAMLVDGVSGLIDYAEHNAVPAAEILPGTGHIAGIVRLEDGLVLIQDLDRFLSLDEERSLEKALKNA